VSLPQALVVHAVFQAMDFKIVWLKVQVSQIAKVRRWARGCT